MRFPIVLSLVALAATHPAHAASPFSARDEKTVARLLAGKTAGTPVPCVSLRNLDTTSIAGGKIYYRASGRLTYVNDPGPGCHLNRNSILITRTTSAQLCAGDIVEVREHGDGVGTGSCGLGAFTPWRTPG